MTAIEKFWKDKMIYEVEMTIEYLNSEAKWKARKECHTYILCDNLKINEIEQIIFSSRKNIKEVHGIIEFTEALSLK